MANSTLFDQPIVDGRLRIDHSALGIEVATLAASLARESRVTHLDMSANDFEADDIRQLIEPLISMPNLAHLDLGGCESLDSTGAGHLAKLVAQTRSLVGLHLADCRIGDQGVRSLVSGLAGNTSLVELGLCLNGLGVDSVRCLAQAAMQRLTSLDLSDNRVGADGVRHIARALRANSSLKSLHLGQCGIDRDGVLCLADALADNTTLAGLCLVQFENRCTDEDHGSLAPAFVGNWSLTRLHLGTCEPEADFAGCERLTDRNKRYQTQRRRIRDTLGTWRTAINVDKYKRYLRRAGQG